MTRFLTQQVVNLGGKRITVMTRPSDDITALAARAPKVVYEARTLLRRTEALLKLAPPERVVKLAHRYFLTGKLSLPKADLSTIRSVVVLISNGLSSDVTIKVGSSLSFNGEVSSVPSTSSRPVKAYHTTATRLSTAESRRYGAIKVLDTRFESDLGVKTFLHEASHKFAGTIDYCYFEDDGVTPGSTFDDKARALMNADSFAWFVLAAGRSWTQA